MVLLRPTPPGRQPTNRKIITIGKSLEGVKGPSPTLGSLAPSCTERMNPLEYLALKASRADFQEGQRTIENRDSALKGSSHAPRSRAETIL